MVCLRITLEFAKHAALLRRIDESRDAYCVVARPSGAAAFRDWQAKLDSAARHSSFGQVENMGFFLKHHLAASFLRHVQGGAIDRVLRLYEAREDRTPDSRAFDCVSMRQRVKVVF